MVDGCCASGPKQCTLKNFPNAKVLEQDTAANPGKHLDAKQTALMYGRAIHWLSFLDILWPNFEAEEWVNLEVADIVVNDPDEEALPPSFYQQMAHTIAMFWRIQLEALYPDGGWTVEIDDDPEITIEAHLPRRK